MCALNFLIPFLVRGDDESLLLNHTVILKGDIQHRARTVRGPRIFSVARVLEVRCHLDPDGSRYVRRRLCPPGNMDP
jgi:hypothetical protein